MELKFSAVVTLSELDIRGLITAEIMRRHPDVKVTGVNYNIYQSQLYGGVVAAGNGNIIGMQPTSQLTGASVTVEKK